MIARIRKSMEQKDQGFTLIELLVVMIIIGILAAIAIPIFMNQRKKAQDSAAISDVSTLGKEIATYYVDATGTNVLGATAITIASNRYSMAIPGGSAQDLGKVSNGITAVTITPGGTNVVDASQNWCVQLTYEGGTKTVVSYSASGGLNKTGGCS